MGNNVKILLIGLFFLAAAYNIQAAKKQLECWHCSSDTIGAEDFCGETFDEDNIPTDSIKERNISILRNCNSTINSEHEQAVCRKTVEEIEGKRITKRFCYYANISDQLDHCLLDATDKNVRRIYCGDCKTDRCNSATQQAATYGTILLPLILSKIFMI